MDDSRRSPSPALPAIRRWLAAPLAAPFRWQALVELELLLIWAVYVGRAYLDMDPGLWPNGREFGMAIQPHYAWTLWKTCGACLFWNGFSNGGYPAFAELHAGVLHPLVVVATLVWGGLNGSKIVLIGSLLMAGLAQWWLAQVLGLGRLARLWSAGMAVVGGHLAGRMEIGVVGVVLSTAAASLVIAPGLKLARQGRTRDAVLLAMMLALALVAGQGYLQLGLLVSILPAFALFWVNGPVPSRRVLKQFFLAGGLALLLAAVFWLPLLHFWPEFGKPVDFDFSAAQSIQYVPLNLVISDVDFYFGDSLDKNPFAYTNMNYIGWIPVLLALLALRLVPRSQQRLLAFFAAAAGLVLLASSGLTFRGLARFLPEFFAGVRNTSLIAGLLVPLVLALAAWSVDRLLQVSLGRWKSGQWTRPPYARLTAAAGLLLLIGLLALSLRNAYRFGQAWLGTVPRSQGSQQVIDAARAVGTQWLAMPYGEQFWGPIAAEAGLKLTDYVRPWHWRERALPRPYLLGSRLPLEDTDYEFLRTIDGVNLGLQREQDYASISGAGEDGGSCQAVARGGNIDVFCQGKRPGQLLVRENRWPGWRVSVDGQPADLLPGPWLSTAAPAGSHYYAFRYRPWDVAAGLGLSLVGWLLAAWLWLRYPGRVSAQEKVDHPLGQ